MKLSRPIFTLLISALLSLATTASPLSDRASQKLSNDIRRLVGQHSHHGNFAVAVVDRYKTQVSINAKKPYPLASVFKLPLLVAILSAQEEQSFPSPNSTLTVGISDQCIGSGRLADSGVGAKVTVDKACRLMMSISDNTATDLLFRKFGEEKLDPVLRGWGFKSSRIILTNRQAWLLSLGQVPGWGKTSPWQRIKNWTSLSRKQQLAKAATIEKAASSLSLRRFQQIEDGSVGTQSSAQDRELAARLDNKMSALDLAKLIMDVEQGKILNASSKKRFLSILAGQKYHTRLPRKLSSRSDFYHKTGTLSGVRDDAGLLYAPGQSEGVAIVFLSHGVVGSSNGKVDRLAGQIAKLVEKAYQR